MSRTRIRVLRFTLWSTAVLLFAGLLGISAGHNVLIFGYDHAFSRIAEGDSLSQVVALMGPAHEIGPSNLKGGTDHLYRVCPFLLGENLIARTQWRIVVDRSGRVMHKQRRDNGC